MSCGCRFGVGRHGPGEILDVVSLLALAPVILPAHGSGPTWLVWVGAVLIVAGIGARVATWRSRRARSRKAQPAGVRRRAPGDRSEP